MIKGTKRKVAPDQPQIDNGPWWIKDPSDSTIVGAVYAWDEPGGPGSVEEWFLISAPSGNFKPYNFPQHAMGANHTLKFEAMMDVPGTWEWGDQKQWNSAPHPDLVPTAVKWTRWRVSNVKVFTKV